MSADERKLEIALTALDEIHVVALPGTHAHDTAHAAMDRMSALPEPPAPDPRLVALDPALLHKELRELTRNHDELLEELLQNAGEEHGSDEGAAEAIAVRYVRRLEAEAERLACVVRDIQIASGNALKSAEDRYEEPEPAEGGDDGG